MLSLGYVTVTIFFKICVIIIIIIDIKINEKWYLILSSLTYEFQDINEILFKVALNTITPSYVSRILCPQSTCIFLVPLT